MTDRNKVWIDPDDCGLATVAAAERKHREEMERQQREAAERRVKEEAERRRAEAKRKREADELKRRQAQKEIMECNEEEKKAQALVIRGSNPEVVLPDCQVPAMPTIRTDSLGLPDLADLKQQIKHFAKLLDLSVPEGFLDALFGRPDRRIDIKTERALRLAGYVEAYTRLLEAAKAHRRISQEVYLERLAFLRRVKEEQCQTELVRNRADRQDAIEAAQAREVIADLEAKIREHDLRGRPAPPPPAPPPRTPRPKDPRVTKKKQLEKEIERLDKEQKERLAKIVSGKPQAEWTQEEHEEVRRTVNMYYHAKEKKREELRECL